MSLSIGVDIGGTNTCIGVVSSDGVVHERTQFRTEEYDDGAAFAERLAKEVRTVMKAHTTKSDSWTGLGIGAPNGNYLSGSIEEPPNLRFKGTTPLVALLEEGRVSFRGELIQCEADSFFEPGPHFPVVAAALGPQALKVAGQLCDGTTLAWTGPRTIREHIAPRIREAAAEAGRPEPRIIATLPVCVTDDETRVREKISETLALYGQLPSYAAMFEREGVDTPGELALAGSPGQVRDQLGVLAEAGVTDFAASAFPTSREEGERTRELLCSLVADG